MAENEQLGKLMKVLDPEQSGQTMKQMQDIASRAAEAKAFKPDVPMLPNPEVARLESMLTQAKAQKPNIPGLDVANLNPTNLKTNFCLLFLKLETDLVMRLLKSALRKFLIS